VAAAVGGDMAPPPTGACCRLCCCWERVTTACRSTRRRHHVINPGSSAVSALEYDMQTAEAKTRELLRLLGLMNHVLQAHA
jgi:hypothetical protein